MMDELDTFIFANAREQYSGKLMKIYLSGRVLASDDLSEIRPLVFWSKSILWIYFDVLHKILVPAWSRLER
jgi:hypothetical protein